MEIVNGKLIDKITTYDEYLENDEMARKRQGYAEAAEDDNQKYTIRIAPAGILQHFCRGFLV